MASKIFTKFNMAIILVFVIAVAIWASTPFVIRVFTVNLEQSGQFGDMFGAVNALFSCFGTVGIVFTLLKQSEQLKLQESEIAEARKSRKIEHYMDFMKNEPLFVIDERTQGLNIYFTFFNYGKTAFNINFTITPYISDQARNETVAKKIPKIQNGESCEVSISAMQLDGTKFMIGIQYTNSVNQLNFIELAFIPGKDYNTASIAEIRNRVVEEFKLDDIHGRFKDVPNDIRGLFFK